MPYLVNRMSRNKSLDLHGVRHADVSRTVDQFLGQHRVDTNLIISASLVRESLKDYGLTAEEDIINKGMLTIKL